MTNRMAALSDVQRKGAAMRLFAGVLLAFLLAACGGGSGGGSGGDSSGGSSGGGLQNNPPVANAGVDRTVNAGDVVELNAVGTDSDGTVTGYSWRRLEGPSVALNFTDLQKGLATFVAPETGHESSLKLVYELTVTDNEGAVGRDTVTFIINRVNKAPVADAGSDQRVKGLSKVVLLNAGEDDDGDIRKHEWEQVDGPAVTLGLSQEDGVEFTAPSTPTNLILTFRLTVTDNDGATGSDDVTVIVTPENAPDIDLVFPTPAGVYTSNSVEAFGRVTPVGTATIASVRVSLGENEVAATIDAEGYWRSAPLALPGGAEHELLVIAEDSDGIQGELTQVLHTTGHVDASPAWPAITAVAAIPGSEKVYVLTTSASIVISSPEVKLDAVDIKTGTRSPVVANFLQGEQAVQDFTFSYMIYVDGKLYLTSTASHQEPQIISVDPVSGVREVVSSTREESARGTGPAFSFLAGLVAGPAGKVLAANHSKANNGRDEVISVDLATGDREIVYDHSTHGGVFYPLYLTWHFLLSGDEKIGILANTDQGVIFDLTKNDSAVQNAILTENEFNEGPAIKSTQAGIHYSQTRDGYYVFNSADDNLIFVKADGDKELIAADVVGDRNDTFPSKRGFDYDDETGLIFIAYQNNFYVIDARTGNKIHY